MKFNWLAFIGFVASGGLAVLVQALGAAFPSAAVEIANIVAIIVALAAVIYQFYTGTSSKIAADAPVVDAAGAVVGTNVSTTSTLPIAAPQAPKV